MKVLERDILKDKNLAVQLVKDGVVKIPFLTPEELSNLNAFYTSVHPDGNPPAMNSSGVHMTVWHPDQAYKRKINAGIKSVIQSACERTFENYRTITEQFVIKKQGAETTFEIHQDWAVVDEENFFSLNMWIPLQDVNESTGAMWIVKGSHKINQKIRGAGILYPNYTPFVENLKPYMTSFNMKAGEILIFYHCTLHGSSPNQNNAWRKSVQVSLVPQNAPLQVYFQKDTKSPLEIHQPDDDFCLNYEDVRIDSVLKPPTTKPIKLIENYSYSQIEMDSILSAIAH